jgi:hypothetical protein
MVICQHCKKPSTEIICINDADHNTVAWVCPACHPAALESVSKISQRVGTQPKKSRRSKNRGS